MNKLIFNEPSNFNLLAIYVCLVKVQGQTPVPPRTVQILIQLLQADQNIRSCFLLSYGQITGNIHSCLHV